MHDAPMIEYAIDDPRWQELVDADPEALPFHHPAWARLLADAYSFRPFVLALEDGSGSLTAGIPVMEIGRGGRKRWIALPFPDVCPPLANGAILDDVGSLLEAARVAAGAVSFEVRAAISGPPPASEAALRHVLPLSGDPQEVAARFRSSVRRNIRAAEKTGATVRTAGCEEDLTQRFYRLHVEVRRRLGLPVQPRRFFRLLWSRMIEANLGRVTLVETGDATVAAAVFLTWNRSVVYKYGASDSRYWSLRPNNLLFSEAITWACTSGYEQLDFGRTEVSSDSLRRFKLGWGTEEHPLEYAVLGTDAGAGRIRAPRLVRSAIRRSPRWVVRALGEVLYRRAA
jgi:CelD/BcsL family acetyltransferase involved in cellulose biosynthesis